MGQEWRCNNQVSLLIHTACHIVNRSLGSTPNKCFRYTVMSKHPAYLGLVCKTEDWLKAQWANCPPNESSIKIKHSIFFSQNDLQIVATMVQDIRRYREDTCLYCVVCLMLVAHKNNKHEAGTQLSNSCIRWCIQWQLAKLQKGFQSFQQNDQP